MRLLVFLLFVVPSALAQTAPPVYPVTEEEIKAALNGVSEHAGKIDGMLRQLDPAVWTAKGAAATYATQFQSTLDEIGSIRIEMATLSQQPAVMSGQLKALFRIGSYHQRLRALLGAVRQYQNPALADLIESVAAEDQSDVDRIQQYVTELATDREHAFELVNAEAQRCRGILSKQPADAPRVIRK